MKVKNPENERNYRAVRAYQANSQTKKEQRVYYLYPKKNKGEHRLCANSRLNAKLSVSVMKRLLGVASASKVEGSVRE